MLHRLPVSIPVVFAAGLAALAARAAEPVEVRVFQPGQVNWEWLLVPAEHGSGGARRIREGRPCLACHELEEDLIGEAMVAGGEIAEDPPEGLPGHLELEVAAGVADGELKLELRWPAVEAASPSGLSEVPVMVTVALADGEALPPARNANCWIACHADNTNMPAAEGRVRTLYLPNSRRSMTRTGGGDDYRPKEELQAELERGAFLEFSTVFVDEQGVRLVHDSYVLDTRHAQKPTVTRAEARRENGDWVVEISRPLAPAEGHRHRLTAGQSYPFGIAVHENHATGRYHYVSFPHRIEIGEGSATVRPAL